MQKPKTTKKFSLGYFIWMGCNYVISIGFLGNFAVLSNLDRRDAIGIHVLWLIPLLGFVVGMCAYACAKLARVHHSHNNGGAYIYVRTSCGRFWGIFVAFMQYVSLPFLITFQILNLIRTSFGAEWVSTISRDSAGHITNIVVPWYAANWGSFGDLWLDLIGIIIYLIFSFVIFGGLKLYKKITNSMGIIRYVTAGLLILAGLVLACQHGNANLHYWTTNSHGTLNGYIKAFNSCFYFFTGFEIFATTGRNIAYAKRNISWGIIIVLLLNILTHVVIALIFFAAFRSFYQNMNMGTWNGFHNPIILIGGAVMMIISTIALKINLVVQDNLYGGTSLQPLAREGFLPTSLKKLNRDGLPTRAIRLNIVLTLGIIFIWLIIPDLIKGITLTCQDGFMCTLQDNLRYPQPLNVSSLTASSSAITIFIYLMVIFVVLKLGLQQKLKMRMWEWIIFPVISVILGVTLFWHYYSLIHDLVILQGAQFNSKLIGVVVELFFISGVSLFIIIWYFTYYHRQYHHRLQTNPAYQTWLNQEFMLIDDWNFVQTKICKILSDYLNRHENINRDCQSHRRVLLQLRHKLRCDLDQHQQLEEQENEKDYEE